MIGFAAVLIFAPSQSVLSQGSKTDLGTALLLSRRYAEAEQLGRKAIAQNSMDAGAYIVRGKALAELERPQEALNDLATGLSLSPKSENAWINDCRAKCYVQLGRFDEALVEINKGIDKSPSQQRFRLRGQVYCQMQQYTNALKSFTEAIKASRKGDKPFWNYYDRGNCYANLKMYKEAIADFTQAINFAPSEPQAYATRAKMYDKLGMHELAEKDRHHAERLTDFSM